MNPQMLTTLKTAFGESINEANIIQKIDKLAKANKYGTVDGTRMNGKTAKEIMAIFMHPKMNSYRQQMMGAKAHELVDLTLTLLKKLNIKVEGEVNEVKENPIDAARRIVKNNQSEKVGGVLVDMQTANLIVQIYDKVNSSNKKKMEKTPMKKLGVLVWKVAKKARR